MYRSHCCISYFSPGDFITLQLMQPTRCEHTDHPPIQLRRRTLVDLTSQQSQISAHIPHPSLQHLIKTLAPEPRARTLLPLPHQLTIFLTKRLKSPLNTLIVLLLAFRSNQQHMYLEESRSPTLKQRRVQPSKQIAQLAKRPLP